MLGEGMAKKKKAAAQVVSAAPGFLPGAPQSFMPPGSPGAAPQAVPMQGPINASDYAASNFLRGQDVPTSQNEIKVKVLSFVKIPGSRSPLVCQIEKAYDREFLPLNKTNIKQLAGIVGNNLQIVVGKSLVLVIYPVNNPSTGQMTRGLYVSRVE
jgi:hypothetical protein